MKKYAIIFVLLLINFLLMSQPLQLKVQKVEGNHKVRTLLINPGYEISIGKLVSRHDTLRDARYYKGIFLGGMSDSLTLKLNTIKEEKLFGNGTFQSWDYPVKQYPLFRPCDSIMHYPIREIDYLSFNKPIHRERNIGVPVLLGSLALMVLSPLISYNFNDHSINAGRFKYWGIGSTIGFVGGFTYLLTANKHNKHRYQFQTDWPYRSQKVWKFQHTE